MEIRIEGVGVYHLERDRVDGKITTMQFNLFIYLSPLKSTTGIPKAQISFPPLVSICHTTSVEFAETWIITRLDCSGLCYNIRSIASRTKK